FKNQHGLADARAAEQTDLATFDVRLHQVHNLDAGLEHFQVGGLIFQSRSGAVNGIVSVGDDGTELVNRFAEHAHHAAQRCTTDRDDNGLARVEGLHSADHAFGRLHGDRADAPVAEVLLHFHGHVERFRQVVAFAGDAHRVVNRGQVSGLELNIQDWSNYLDHVSYCCVLLGHLQLL